VDDERRAQDGPEHGHRDGKLRLGLAGMRVGEHQPDRVDGHRQRVQTEHQVLGLSPMNEIRDAERQPDPDIREYPREKHSSEKLGEHAYLSVAK